MTRKLLIGLAGAILLFTACSASTATKAPTHLEEDDPGWDCHTMGNRTCGPDPTIPTPPGFICQAEDNSDMPDGKEVICYRMAPNPDMDSIPG